MATKTYQSQILDQTAYEPTSDLAGFIEYVVRFTNPDDTTDTFDTRIDTDGTDLDFQNECRKFLETKFAPPPVDKANPAHTFEVGGQTVNILS